MESVQKVWAQKESGQMASVQAALVQRESAQTALALRVLANHLAQGSRSEIRWAIH
jgi:phage gp46-like protein